jgi:hypothetical protein
MRKERNFQIMEYLDYNEISSADGHVNMELDSDISEAFSVSIIRADVTRAT